MILISTQNRHQLHARKPRPGSRACDCCAVDTLHVRADQPSQVYFPADKDVDGSMGLVPDDDRHRVQQMFRLIFEAVEAVAPGLQVILIEHADLNEDWYRDAIVERWRGGKKLVPEDWPRAGGGAAE